MLRLSVKWYILIGRDVCKTSKGFVNVLSQPYKVITQQNHKTVTR